MWIRKSSGQVDLTRASKQIAGRPSPVPSGGILHENIPVASSAIRPPEAAAVAASPPRGDATASASARNRWHCSIMGNRRCDTSSQRYWRANRCCCMYLFVSRVSCACLCDHVPARGVEHVQGVDERQYGIGQIKLAPCAV